MRSSITPSGYYGRPHFLSGPRLTRRRNHGCAAEIPGRRVRVLVRPSIMMSPSTRSIHLRTKFHGVGGYLITCLPARTLQNKCYNINYLEVQQGQVTSNHGSHYDMKVFRADACANLLGAGSLPGGQWPKAHHGDI